MKLTYKGTSIVHYRPAWRNGDEVIKIENGGDPRLMVCINAEINSGSTGISNWKWESTTASELPNRRIIETL